MDAVLQNFKRSFGLFIPLFQSLSLDPPTIMEKLYKQANRYSMLEGNIRAVTHTIMITNQSAEGKMPPGKKPSKPKEGQSEDRK